MVVVEDGVDDTSVVAAVTLMLVSSNLGTKFCPCPGEGACVVVPSRPCLRRTTPYKALCRSSAHIFSVEQLLSSHLTKLSTSLELKLTTNIQLHPLCPKKYRAQPHKSPSLFGPLGRYLSIYRLK